MPPRMQPVLVTTISLIKSLSVAIVALAARHIFFYKNLAPAKRLSVDVIDAQFNLTSSRWEPEKETIAYVPRDFTMRDTYALPVAGLLGIVLGAGLLATVMRSKEETSLRVSITGKNLHTLTIVHSRVALIMNSALVGVLAIATGLSWHGSKNPHWYPSSIFNGRYHDGLSDWTFETWNCALAPRIAPSMWRVTTPMLNSLCDQARAARYMVLLTFILAVLAWGLQLWAWRRRNITARQRREAAALRDEEVAWKRQDDSLEIEAQRPECKVGTHVASPVTEQGRAAEMERVELPDGSIKEMMVEGQEKELAGDVVGVEKPADEKREKV